MPGGMFQMVNFAQAMGQLRFARERAKDSFDNSLERAAKDIMMISQTQYVPIDTGALMGSGRVAKVVVPRVGNTYELIYGGPPDYAVIVHERNLNYRNGRQWKYLETPAKEYDYEGGMTVDMRRSLAAALGGVTSQARRGSYRR